MICSFTGHRDMKEFSEELFVKTLEHLIQNEKVDVFYDGMARGFDLYAAKKVIELKKKYPRIGLVACIPYGGQIEGMKGSDREIRIHGNYVYIFTKGGVFLTVIINKHRTQKKPSKSRSCFVSQCYAMG